MVDAYSLVVTDTIVMQYLLLDIHTHSSLVSYWVVVWVNYIIVIIWSFLGVIWNTTVDKRYLRIADFSVIPIRAIRSVVSNSKRIAMLAVLTSS